MFVLFYFDLFIHFDRSISSFDAPGRAADAVPVLPASLSGQLKCTDWTCWAAWHNPTGRSGPRGRQTDRQLKIRNGTVWIGGMIYVLHHSGLETKMLMRTGG